MTVHPRPLLALLLPVAMVTLLVPAPLSAAGVDLAELVDGEVTYDPAIPTPASSLGFAVGERHARHDQIVAYLTELAAASERVAIEGTGRTHEDRPLTLVTVSTPENLARLEAIRRAHRTLSEGEGVPAEADVASMPVIVWLGYSIHGDEASGSNAAPLVAYHLAAATGEGVESLLEEAVVLIDPSLNPDGLGRFTQWVNSHRGRQPAAERLHREHLQAWPGGRTNHYLFDLNRDWLLLQHPESRARVEVLQGWRPNVVADFHEMGSDSTYFFQPGVPSRRNPMTPEANVALTEALAEHHAETLDRRGRLYYTEETFDDYYYGKGSTYPDIQGSVGILFEQASARGHAMETDAGERSFAFAVENQFLTSLSTLAGAVANRRELLTYQAEFYRRAREEAAAHPAAGYLVGDDGDPARAHHLIALLRGHGIAIHELARPIEADGLRFEPGSAFWVPLEQRQHRLVRALMERVTSFPDTTFYDVSTWTLPLAFDLPHAAVERGEAEGLAGAPIEEAAFPAARVSAGESPVAYAFDWSGYYAPPALGRLLAAGVRARVATRPLTAQTTSGRRSFGAGTVIIPRRGQPVAEAELVALVEKIAERDAVEVVGLASGLTPEGVDLGSPSVEPVEPPRPRLVVGRGVSAYDAGEVWHLLDHRFRLELPLVPLHALDRLDLEETTHLILVDGDYGRIGEETRKRLGRWLHGGGVVVATRGGASWVQEILLSGATPEEADEPPAPGAGQGEDDAPPALSSTAYGDYREQWAAQQVGGAIFEVTIDRTHPIAFGYQRPRLPVFRESNEIFEASDNPFENVALYTGEPLLSGYASEHTAERVAGTAAVVVKRVGEGTAVLLVDDPSFRAFWYGTQKLLLNGLFFGTLVERTRPPEGWF